MSITFVRKYAVITSGFRLLIDDFRDLREQIRNALLRLKKKQLKRSDF